MKQTNIIIIYMLILLKLKMKWIFYQVKLLLLRKNLQNAHYIVFLPILTIMNHQKMTKNQMNQMNQKIPYVLRQKTIIWNPILFY